MKHRSPGKWLLLVAMLCALAAPGCATLRDAYDDTRAGDVSAPADEALRAVAAGYETLAAARETVLLLYVGGMLDKPKALQARDALVEVGKTLAQAEAVLQSGLPEQALALVAFAVARAEAVVKEVRG